jgi:1-acyl-sn-glycerol-3-phosphate acyltransferase
VSTLISLAERALSFLVLLRILLKAREIAKKMSHDLKSYDRSWHERIEFVWKRAWELSSIMIHIARVQVHVEGDNAPHWNKRVKRVLVVNHQSLYDPFILNKYCPYHQCVVVAKVETTRFPYSLIHVAYPIAVSQIIIDRKKGREAREIIKDAIAELRETMVVVFASGTRDPEGKIGVFKSGAFEAAVEMGCEIIPVAICGTSEILPAKSLKLTMGLTVRLEFGDPIISDGQDFHDLRDKVWATINEMLERNQKLLHSV